MPSPFAELATVIAANLIAAWVLTYVAHSTLLLGSAWLLTKRLAGSPALESVVWRTALFGGPVTATIQVMLLGDGISRLAAESLAGIFGPRPIVSLLVLAAWTGLILAGLARLGVGHWRLLRAIGQRRELDHEEVAGFPARAPMLSSKRVAPRLTASRTLAAPAAVGPGEICIPDHVLERFTPAERQSLVAHELGHVTRRDPLWAGAAGALAGVMVFQPLNRLAISRMRRAAELAADDFAVSRIDDPASLARALARLATGLDEPGRVAAPIAALSPRSPLVLRIDRILARGPTLTPTPRRRTVAGLSLAALATVAVLAPGVSASPEVASDGIPWLAPSSEEPNPRMLQVRDFDPEEAFHELWSRVVAPD